MGDDMATAGRKSGYLAKKKVGLDSHYQSLELCK